MIFDITDSMPAHQLKEIGPAAQTIDIMEGKTFGWVVSRLQHWAGVATSIMTTRCDILGRVAVMETNDEPSD